MDGDENSPSTRSGLRNLYCKATSSSRLLVISRVSNQRVLPWIVSSTRAVRCYDTVSMSQKLSLHRHAKVPILMHVFLWDRLLFPTSGSSSRFGMAHSPPAMALGPKAHLSRQPNKNQVQPLPLEISDDDIVINDNPQYRLERDTAGEPPFRFHDFALPNNWVSKITAPHLIPSSS